jgi:hypothetical protein
MADAATASITIGSFLYETVTKSGDVPVVMVAVPKFHVCDGTAKSLTYVTSGASAGDIYLVVFAPGISIVGKAEQTLTASASAQDIMVTSLI